MKKGNRIIKIQQAFSLRSEAYLAGFFLILISIVLIFKVLILSKTMDTR